MKIEEFLFNQPKGKTMSTNININGIEYTPASPKIQGTRAVIVVDRGWIFAGDVLRENGRIKLTNALWIFRWETIGFDGVIADPKNSKVTIKPIPNGVDMPVGAEVFCVPVADNWGL